MISCLLYILYSVSWQCSSVVRTLVLGQQTFPAMHLINMVDRYFVGNLSAVSQPSRPTQPFIPPGSVIFYFVDYFLLPPHCSGLGAGIALLC